LPASGPLPGSGDSGAERPTVVIKVPGAGAAKAAPVNAKEAALQEMEREILQAQAAKHGDVSALRQLIVVQGPVDAALFKSPKPPVKIEGKVAVIGLKTDEKVVKNLEALFGVPVTTEREKQILETVKSQFAGTGKQSGPMEAKIAGWWPKEGVMAVALVPKGMGG